MNKPRPLTHLLLAVLTFGGFAFAIKFTAPELLHLFVMVFFLMTLAYILIDDLISK